MSVLLTGIAQRRKTEQMKIVVRKFWLISNPGPSKTQDLLLDPASMKA